MKTLSLLLFIMVLGGTQIFAQDNVPQEKDLYNQYENEIGIDIQSIFGSGILGTGLIYKRRMKAKENSPSNVHRALVFELYGSGEILLNSPSDYDIGLLSSQEIRDIFSNSYSITGLIGMEWQHQKKKIQTFYGLKTGYRRSVSTSPSSFFTSSASIDNYFLEISTTRNNTIPVFVYGGIKYFLAPRFSVSVDSKFEVNFLSNTVERNSTGSDLVEDENEKGPKKQSINYRVDILNTLNFSYYF